MQGSSMIVFGLGSIQNIEKSVFSCKFSFFLQIYFIHLFSILRPSSLFKLLFISQENLTGARPNEIKLISKIPLPHYLIIRQEQLCLQVIHYETYLYLSTQLEDV
jgi:hypothetical protein